MIENNMKLQDAKNPNKPTLRKRTDQNKGGSTDPNTTSSPSSTSSPSASSGDSGSSSDDDGRPTLKRRPDDGSQPN